MNLIKHDLLFQELRDLNTDSILIKCLNYHNFSQINIINVKVERFIKDTCLQDENMRDSENSY